MSEKPLYFNQDGLNRVQARAKQLLTEWPTHEEWTTIDDAMGEHVMPTGNLRLHSYCPGITESKLEREWRGSLGTIWGKVPHDR